MSDNLGKVSRYPNRSELGVLDLEDECSCREHRKARRRAAEEGLSPLEKLELIPDWKRALVLVAVIAFLVLLFAGIVDFAAGLAAAFAR